MTSLIIFVIVIIIGFIFREQIARFIVSFFQKKKAPTLEHGLGSSTVFAPAGTVRTFVIALDIEEQGNGSVKITLAKKIISNEKD